MFCFNYPASNQQLPYLNCKFTFFLIFFVPVPVPVPEYVLVPVLEYALVPVPEYVLVPVPEYALVPVPEYVLVPVSEYVLVPYPSTYPYPSKQIKSNTSKDSCWAMDRIKM